MLTDLKQTWFLLHALQFYYTSTNPCMSGFTWVKIWFADDVAFAVLPAFLLDCCGSVPVTPLPSLSIGTRFTVSGFRTPAWFLRICVLRLSFLNNNRCRIELDIMTGENLLSIYPAIYWSVRLSIRRGGDRVKVRGQNFIPLKVSLN